MFSLRPRREKYPDRLLCEVKVVDNTKIVTIRSTYKVENLTLYPMELMLVDNLGHPVYSLEKIVPGQEFSLPIEAVTKHRIRIQPDRKQHLPIRKQISSNYIIQQCRGLWIQVVAANPLGGSYLQEKLYSEMRTCRSQRSSIQVASMGANRQYGKFSFVSLE